MQKWFLGFIGLLIILVLVLGYLMGEQKTVPFNVASIKPRGLIDTKILKHSIDFIPLLQYPPTKDGDAGNEYLKALQIYNPQRVFTWDNANKQYIFHIEAPELDYFLKAAEYKSCDVYSLLSTSAAINKHPFLALQIMIKALVEKGNKFVLSSRPDKGLRCYEAGLLLSYWMTKVLDKNPMINLCGFGYGKITLDPLVRYHQNKGDSKKIDLWEAYRKESEKMSQTCWKKFSIEFPIDIDYNANPLLYKYTGINKPFTVNTTGFDALIEMALFDESTIWRAGAVNSLGAYRFLTQEDVLGMTFYADKRVYSEEIMKYIETHDKDPNVREAAKKALNNNAKETKKEIIDSILSYQATMQALATSTTSAPTPTPSPIPTPKQP